MELRKNVAQSLANILVHIIFSTKNRAPFIKLAVEDELFPYLASIFKANRSRHIK